MSRWPQRGKEKALGPFTMTGLSPKATSPKEDLYLNLGTVLPVHTGVYLNLKQLHWVFKFFSSETAPIFCVGPLAWTSSQH